MKGLILTAAVTTLLAAPAARAQSEAEYYTYVEEQAVPTDDDVDEMANAPDVSGVDVSSEGASSGESGLSEEDYDVAPPGAPVPEE